nr:putative ribonuclease H-like domain-containing protein [Tanacetum cinerariifolium]
SLTHLIKDCDFYEQKIAQTTTRNHAKRGNHQQYPSMPLLNPQRHVVPIAVIPKSKLVPINAARPVTTVVPKPHVTRPKPTKPIVTKPYLPSRRHINQSPSPKASSLPPKVTTVKGTCLSDFEELNGGYVAFGGNPKREKVKEEIVQQYVLFPIWSSGSTNPYNTDEDATFDEKEPEFEGRKPESEVNVSPSKFKDFSNNSINEDNAAGTLVLAVGQIYTNNTNTFSVDGPSNAAVSPTHGKSPYVDSSQLPDDPNMLELKDITYFGDEEDVCVEADFTNLETSITVSPIPTTRVNKDHHVTQIIGDLSLATQTRSMSRVAQDQDGLSQINNDDFHTCMFACFLSQEEPKRVHQALKDPSWIEAMQEELLQFKMQKVWVLVDLPHEKRAIEEGIHYEEVFSPVARIEAIRLFLAYASFMGFMVYQMDVKSAFLYETIEKEVYVCQPSGFEDLDYPDKVYKVVKVLYGLHQASRAWYETLANYHLKNGFQKGKIDQTLFIKRQKYDILFVQIYVDDIIFGSTNKDLCKAFEKLIKDMLQMSSIGELIFFLGLQVKQKKDGIFISHDKYVAEILRKFGLTDGKSASTPIDTEKPLLKDPNGEDVDVHTYRSMIGSLMYLNSSRPDIMFAVCACARFQVTPKVSKLHAVKRIFRYLKGKPHFGLWYLKDSPFNLVVYSDSDYAGASLARKSTTGGCQFLRCRLICWQYKKQTVVATSSIRAEYVATVNDVSRLQALVDKKWVIITEATVRDALRLADAEGIDCLPNEEIFTELARMGYKKPSTKITFYKAFFLKSIEVSDSHNTTMVEKRCSRVETPLFEGMIVEQQVGKGVAEVNVDDVFAVGVANEGAASVTDDVVPTSVEEPSIPSPAPPTPPPQPSQDIPSTSQIAQALEITKLKQSVRREEIADMDTDVDVTLKDIAKDVDVDAEENDEVELAELQEVVEVVTTAKLITKVVIAASATITVVAPQLTTAAPTLTNTPSAASRRKGIVIRDPKETTTPSTIIHSGAKSKDKGKRILVEEPKPLKKQTQIEHDEAYARDLKAKLNKNIDWDEGMTYDDVRLIFEKKFNSNVASLAKTKEQMEEQDSRALKRLSGSQEDKAAKKQKLNEKSTTLNPASTTSGDCLKNSASVGLDIHSRSTHLKTTEISNISKRGNNCLTGGVCTNSNNDGRQTSDPQLTRSGQQVLRAAPGEHSRARRHIHNVSNDYFYGVPPLEYALLGCANGGIVMDVLQALRLCGAGAG